MLDDLRGGCLDAVVVWDLDRLHRQPRELEEFFDLCKAAGCRSWRRSAATSISRRTTGSSLLVSSGLWLPRRATTRAAGFGARRRAGPGRQGRRRRLTRLRLRGRQAHYPRVRGSGDPRVRREAACRGSAALDLQRPERPRRRDLDRRRVAGTDATADVAVGSDRGAAGTQRRDRRRRGVARDHQPSRLDPHPGALSDPDRRTNKVARRYLLVRLLRCGLCGETLVSAPSRAAYAPTMRQRPRLLGLRPDLASRPTRWRSSWSRPSSTGSTRPSSQPR